MSSAPGQYLALVTREEGSDWNVVFPDRPGCVTAGRSLDEAVAFAEEALVLHVQGLREDGEARRSGLGRGRPSWWVRVGEDAGATAAGAYAFFVSGSLVDTACAPPEPASRISFVMLTPSARTISCRRR